MGVGIVLELPCSGACVCGASRFGCLEIHWGFGPWVVPLMVKVGLPGMEASGDFGLLFVLWPCDVAFLVGGYHETDIYQPF